MYDELVKQLRNDADYMGNNGITLYAVASRYRECAVAIEELTAVAESYMRSMEAWADEAARAQSRWIPVTEEPPLKVGDDGYNGYLVYANDYYEVADYTTDKFDNSPYFHVNGEYEPTVTHWMPLPPAPEPPKEEVSDV